jgi:hypothetical protein
MDKNSFTSNKKLNNEEEIFKIIKGADSINKYHKENIKTLDSNYLITPKDIKIFQFIFKYFFNSLKYKDIINFFRFQNTKIICRNEQINNNDTYKNLRDKSNYIITKFINFFLYNHIQLSKIFHKTDGYFLNNVLKIMKILYLNDFMNEKDFNNIIFLQTILCLYKDDKKCINIQNANQLYIVINHLISFCSNNHYKMNNTKLTQFNNSINYFISIINEYLLLNDSNFNNKNILARNKMMYNLIELSQITSNYTTSKIIKLLVNIYAYKLKIDYVFDDLSEQFLHKIKKESLQNKTNLLMAKNYFLHELLEKEKSLLQEENVFIKNGFFFNDCPNNGISCDSINKFPNENDGDSIVVSFRLMNNNNKTEDKNI